MLYVQQSLAPDEELIHIGQFHWTYTLNALLSVVWGLFFALFIICGAAYVYQQMGWYPKGADWLEAVRYLHPGLRIAAFVMFALGVFSFAHMMVIKATTEIAITNNRLVYKRGLIARQVGEMNIHRIESVDVLQSVFGRMLGYGRLVIHGMGVGQVVLPPVGDPILFRKAIERAKVVQ